MELCVAMLLITKFPIVGILIGVPARQTKVHYSTEVPESLEFSHACIATVFTDCQPFYSSLESVWRGDLGDKQQKVELAFVQAVLRPDSWNVNNRSC
mmetsp:Transcript_4686/g.17688  ORF Transcript_4686/g.17688 Transcript_4686/m.17688 type:complete len:97 (-) Transcript_4686:468-758(-)